MTRSRFDVRCHFLCPFTALILGSQAGVEAGQFCSLLVPISDIHRNQFQAQQQRTRIRNQFDMSASRARQNSVAGNARSQARAHQLISLQLLFTAQATNRFLIGIGRDTSRCLEGWFHTLLVNKKLEQPNSAEIPTLVDRVYHGRYWASQAGGSTNLIVIRVCISARWPSILKGRYIHCFTASTAAALSTGSPATTDIFRTAPSPPT